MLHTQYHSAASGFGAFGDAASVKAMQETLRRLGNTSISVSGTVDGPTAAAVYRLIRDNVSLIPKIPSSVKTVFDKIKSFDSTIRQYTFGRFDSSMLFQYAPTIISAVQSLSSSVATTIQSGLNEFYSAINATAPALNVAFTILASPTPPPTQSSPAMATIMSSLLTRPITATMTAQPASSAAAPVVPAGSIYAYSAKIGKYRIAIPNPAGFAGLGVQEVGALGDCVFGDCGFGAAYTEIAPAGAPPANAIAVTESDLEKKTGNQPIYKKPWFWAAVGGGVAVLGTGGYFLIRRKRSA